MMRLTLPFVLLVLFTLVTAHPQGADTQACNLLDMRPTGHFKEAVDNAITNSSTFSVKVSDVSYMPGGQPLVVTLGNIGEGTVSFLGFLIQARKPNGRDFLARGRFQPTTVSQIRCGSTGKGLTHTQAFVDTRSNKFQAIWDPPSVCDAKNIGDLRFQATFVTGFDEPPHIMVYSPIIIMQPMNNTILCQSGCGVNCPSGAVSLSPSIMSLLFILGVASLCILS